MTILGLTGKEPVIKLKKNKFCSLCSRVIRRGHEAVSAGGGRYFIHPDCGIAEMTGLLHKGEMKDVRRGVRSKSKRQTKKEHYSDGHVLCFFCRKRIEVDAPFVLEDKKAYHSSGRNSCLARYRRVINSVKSSLY
jgi:hypothetical protein